MTKYRCCETSDLFEAMYRGMEAKLEIMRIYPDLGTFVIRSFYEKDPEIAADVQKLYESIRRRKGISALENLDLSKFRDDLDFEMVHREMYLASEGYLWELTQRGETVSLERLRKDFTALIEFWKSVYYKK